VFSVDNRSRGKALGIAVFLSLAAFLQSCSSDLLSAPPATVGVSLTAAPTVTTTFDSASLSFSTDESVTVSVDYGKAPGAYTGSVPRSASGATDHDVAISGLDTATKYYFRVVSYLGSARTFNSAEYSFTTDTDPGVLAIATGPTVAPGLTTLAISWTSNYACTHIMEYGTSAGSYTESTVATTVAGTNHTETLSDLDSGTTYYYRIRLLWNAGDDYASTESNATTTAEATPTATQKARGIWMLGGISAASINSVVGTIDLFDPVPAAGYAQGRWFGAAASTAGYTPASFAGYAAYGGKLYVIGGFDSTGAVLNLVQVYDVATDAWSLGANMPTPRANIHASVLNGKIYVLSGSQASATTAWAGAPVPTGACYEYSPGTPGTWVTKTGYTATNNTERFPYAYGSTLYSIGGRSAAAAVAAPAHDGCVPSLNLMTTATTELAMSTPRTGISGVVCKSALYDHAIVLIGGISAITNTTGSFINFSSGLAPTGTMSNLVQYLAYPFATPAAWQPGTNFPGSGIAFGTAILSDATGSDRIYYFGGTSVLGTSAAGSLSVRWIDPPQPPGAWSSSWTTLTSAADMPTGRWGHGAVTLDN